MGAAAFTMGRHVGFGAPPDLFTAAHEAAHYVQQRAGVSLRGGVGMIGDPYERHANLVAKTVVDGGSVESLLDRSVPHTLPRGADATAASPALQLLELTYDDGPDPTTRQTLVALVTGGANATFYLVGHKVATGENWRIVFDIAAAGNWLDNHAFDWIDAKDDHIFMSGTSSERAAKILQTEFAIRDALMKGKADAQATKKWDAIPKTSRDNIDDVIAKGTGRFRTPGFRSHIYSSGGGAQKEAIVLASQAMEAAGLRRFAVSDSATIDPKDWEKARPRLMSRSRSSKGYPATPTRSCCTRAWAFRRRRHLPFSARSSRKAYQAQSRGSARPGNGRPSANELAPAAGAGGGCAQRHRTGHAGGTGDTAQRACDLAEETIDQVDHAVDDRRGAGIDDTRDVGDTGRAAQQPADRVDSRLDAGGHVDRDAPREVDHTAAGTDERKAAQGGEQARNARRHGSGNRKAGDDILHAGNHGGNHRVEGRQGLTGRGADEATQAAGQRRRNAGDRPHGARAGMAGAAGATAGARPSRPHVDRGVDAGGADLDRHTGPAARPGARADGGSRTGRGCGAGGKVDAATRGDLADATKRGVDLGAGGSTGPLRLGGGMNGGCGMNGCGMNGNSVLRRPWKGAGRSRGSYSDQQDGAYRQHLAGEPSKNTGCFHDGVVVLLQADGWGISMWQSHAGVRGLRTGARGVPARPARPGIGGL